MSWTAYFLSFAKSLQTGFSITGSISYNLLFINSAKSKQVSTLLQFLGSLKFRVSQFYYFGNLSCRSSIFFQHFCLASSAIRSLGISQLGHLAARASRSFIFSQHFCLAASAIQSPRVSQLGCLAVYFLLTFLSRNSVISQLGRLEAWASRSLGFSQIHRLAACVSRSFAISQI